VTTPTCDQAATIDLLTTCGELCGVHVDAGPIDETAGEPCALDYSHGLGTVFVLGDVHCLLCAIELVLTVESIAVDVLRIPGVEVGETDTRAAA
jgi:hypothetical protein